MPELYHHALRTGTRVGNFNITRILGVGGFGITYEAYDEDLERKVAMKEFFPSTLALRDADGVSISPREESDAENYVYGLERFLDEAKTLAKFNHPNIVRVSQFIRLNNTAYLIMDYVQGESLYLYLKKQVTLDETRMMEIVMALLEGLQVVHAKQFLHRDIKPANIFICQDGRPVLLDFGSARQAVQDREMTAMVTPGYAPREQYFGKQNQGPWTDLYAIGATMYCCITGVSPNPAPERVTLLRAGELDPVRTVLTEAKSSCSLPVINFILRLMEVDRDDRPQSAEQALEESGQIWDGLLDGNEEIVWDEDFLKAVEKVLVDKRVDNAHELVVKAQENAHSLREIADRLAQSMGADEDKTELLEKTVLLLEPRTEADHSYADAASTLPLYEILRLTQTLLATIIGPEANEKVVAVARIAETREDFYAQLLAQLSDEEHQQEFIAGVKSFDKHAVF